MFFHHSPHLQHRQLPAIVVPSLLDSSSSTSFVSVPPSTSLPLLSILPIPLTSPSSSSSSSPPSSPSLLVSSQSLSVSNTSSASTSVSSTPSPSDSPTSASPSSLTQTGHSLITTTYAGRTTVVVVQETQSVTPITPKAGGFLGNKTAQGFVFTLAGVIALVTVFLAATFVIRRKKRREIDEIISFDPAAVDARRNSMEKTSIRTSEGSDMSSRHAHNH